MTSAASKQKRQPASTRRVGTSTVLLLALPVLLLAGVIALFLTSGGLGMQSSAPVESLDFERYFFSPGRISLHVRNTGPEPLNVAQIVINAAVVRYELHPPGALQRLGGAVIQIEYPWSQAEAYTVRVFSSNAIAFDLEIPVAFETPRPTATVFWKFTLIGLYVGVVPVFLGILWFPALRQLGRRAMVFLMAATAGLLVFLGLDTITEALEISRNVASPFQGIGVIGIGSIGTFLLLDAISRRQAQLPGSDGDRRLQVAFMIATGIGLHNFGEGLAIGAAYNVGEIALGTFLVVGFIVQNITEGLGIIAPVLRDRPGLGRLALMGLIGGAPAVLGAWLGGFNPSPFLAVLFFAVGTGAIFEVVYEIAKLIQRDTAKQAMPFAVLSGAMAGMLLLWVTGLLIK
jgi:zinc transporter ZupT